MLCDICKQKKARIFYTEVINGEKHEQHLCEDCASVYQGFASKDTKIPGLSFGNMLSGILANYAKGLEEIRSSQKQCGRCGMTEQEFLAKGRFGCAECYETFGDVLEDNLKVIQGADVHMGKVPVGQVSARDKESGTGEKKKPVSAKKKSTGETAAAKRKRVTEDKAESTSAEAANEAPKRGRRKKVSAEEAREIKKTELKEKLKKAIEVEEYETAAKLRDEIKALDKVPI